MIACLRGRGVQQSILPWIRQVVIRNIQNPVVSMPEPPLPASRCGLIPTQDWFCASWLNGRFSVRSVNQGPFRSPCKLQSAHTYAHAHTHCSLRTQKKIYQTCPCTVSLFPAFPAGRRTLPTVTLSAERGAAVSVRLRLGLAGIKQINAWADYFRDSLPPVPTDNCHRLWGLSWERRRSCAASCTGRGSTRSQSGNCDTNEKEHFTGQS